MRRWLSFAVDGAVCAATLDDAAGAHGLLIVSGGNEMRSGPHRSMAMLAADVAAAGYPVLRFDRRGIGDSAGENGGFEQSAADIAAALALFRAHCPQIILVSAFGNCDAATALILHHGCAAGPDGLVLANPWTIDAPPSSSADRTTGALPPAAAIRARYRAKLRQPREWLRLLRGGVDLRKLARGLIATRHRPPVEQVNLSASVIGKLATIADCPIRLLVAEQDGTGQAFLAALRSAAGAAVRSAPNIELFGCDTASHSFADDDSRAWLTAQVLDALRN